MLVVSCGEARRLTLPSSGPAYGGPLKSNVRPQMHIPRWLVELEGESLDLARFQHWFGTGDLHVITEGPSAYITGSAFNLLAEPSLVLDAGHQFIDEHYPIVSLLDPSVKKPIAGNVFRESENGERRGYAFAAVEFRAELRAYVNNVAHSGTVCQTHAQLLLAATRSDRHLREAASLLAAPLCSWPQLYRALEEVEQHLARKVNQAGLCSSTQRERFKLSANSAEAAGANARHAFGKFAPPKRPMSLQEGSVFVAGLLKKALAVAVSHQAQSRDAV